MTPEDALKQAVTIVGGSVALAREIGVTSQAVGQWKICPVLRVRAVEAAVNRARKRAAKQITKHDLRPDVYPKGRK
jgi:DNA-binding transcriptional regulator YdaS (Cro superfamily)